MPNPEGALVSNVAKFDLPDMADLATGTRPGGLVTSGFR